MQKNLVTNEAEYVKLFEKLVELEELEIHDVERLLGIEFAYADGTYQSDFKFSEANGIQSDNEDQDVDLKRYRIVSDGGFPEQYPCCVVMHIENTFDRYGNVALEFIEFVYLSDFGK